MTNRELIVLLLNSNLDEEVDLIKTAGNIKYTPVVYAHWVKVGKHSVCCSRCEANVSTSGASSMSYCFRCGAKMREINREY